MFNVFEWCVLVLWCDAFVLIVLSDEPRQNQGRRLVDRKLVKAPPHPSYFTAGRPKAALLFWFFNDFRRGVLLFMVILDIIYKYKKGKNSR